MKMVSVMVSLAVAAAGLSAQQPDSAHAGHHGMGMMEPMMRVMVYMPEHLLMKKEQLGLTDQQVTRITAIRDAAKTVHDAAQADVKTHTQALQQAMQASAPDTTALRQHFQAMHTAMGTAHFAMLKSAAQAKALLTDAQRGRVEGWADAMEMHHEHMRGGHPMGPDSAHHRETQPSR